MQKLTSIRILLVLLMAFSCILTTGCQGCRGKRKSAEQIRKEEEEAKKEREKPVFETEPAVVFPGQYEEAIKHNRTKRGHWVTTDFRITANKFPAQGDLQCNGFAPPQPVPVEDTDYIAVSNRPFSIPKGEPRSLETNVYLPRRDNAANASVVYKMTRRSGGAPLLSELHGFSLQKPFQYHLVVLTNRPDSYGILHNLDTIRLESPEYSQPPPPFYTVVKTRPTEEPITLPRQALNWTTIAYLIWDDLKVEQLDADQQTAMLDWLHFGGQLILSGPDCLDKLKNSFLSDYLPATIAGSRNFVGKDFEELNQHWAIKARKQNIRRVLQVDERSPIIGVDFEVHPSAKFVTNTGMIAVERAIGRGRIVATAVPLSAKPFNRWSCFPSFLNGALLRKPSRKFGTTPEGVLAFSWNGDETSIFDPLLGSTLRYLSRDLVQPKYTDAIGTPVDPEMTAKSITGVSYANRNLNPLGFTGDGLIDDGRFRTTDSPNKRTRNLDDHWHYGGFQHDEQSGTAGWNDNSGISTAARETLQQAAGITPPSSGFVFRMLAIYLIVLVPLNWLLFRMIGRIEWAWIAAPFIAIAGAFMVARMASLDIGFVRSNSQVACLEVFGDYPRAHIAQYSALYTSLSTGYELELDNPSAQSLPLGDPTRNQNRQKTPSPVTLRKTLVNRLEGFQVQSNSTGMLHTEMMIDLLGTISLKQNESDVRVENTTAVTLAESAVLRRSSEGQMQGAWIGEFEAGTTSQVLKFSNIKNATDPWRSSNVLRSRGMAEQYWERLEPFWEKIKSETRTNNSGNNFNLNDLADEEIKPPKIKVSIRQIQQNIPELQTDWAEFVRLAMRRVESTSDGILEAKIDYPNFEQIISLLEKVEGLNVSRLFHTVSTNLALAPGETRLIAVTNQPIGNNSFSPASTQTDEQTLIVVHLERPEFPAARPDTNTADDFTGRSSLDVEEEIRQDEQARKKTARGSESEEENNNDD